MIAIIKQSDIKGCISAPSSKSAMQRAVAASLMAKGESHLTNISRCDDSLASVKIAEALGATVKIGTDDLFITGGFKPLHYILDCGEAGLAARLFTPLAALHNKEIMITGRSSLLKRPVGMMESTLIELGASITTHNGFLPIQVKGPLKGGNASVEGSVSSQFLSGLLMALPVAANNSILHVSDLKSKPYIDLTIAILKQFGITIGNDNYKTFYIAGNQSYKSTDYQVEGDWSGAAFLLVLGALSGEVTVSGLDIKSVQADRVITDALIKAGADIKFENGIIRMKKSNLKCFEFNVSECPDLAPPLVALAARCEGTTILTGTDRLKSKESDRGVTLEQEFNKIGVKVVNRNTSLEITGLKKLNNAEVLSHNDHRIAMALAVIATTSTEDINISGAECVNKSYPDFFRDCQNLGANIELINNLS
jgi:3-phosphoshikimate 1-carboxyvinyltransferase